jgi:hypothetical protein
MSGLLAVSAEMILGEDELQRMFMASCGSRVQQPRIRS